MTCYLVEVPGRVFHLRRTEVLANDEARMTNVERMTKGLCSFGAVSDFVLVIRHLVLASPCAN